ncbi:hypothetical protein CHL67_02030 [Prosthecochloris sp. GSB1]|uniref:glutaredoxin family protein n=1 Tax=Prosthecochloris sp. GSB1 TaxID=281093 RepID=UPI000B8CB6E2|nr:glutaredoxin family protein [Prosthecochloris sp. GSB1]ASQ89859.1 hypothetical protein CHL67_02030 [Prosthecochloris sp. GSB1]
MLTLKKVTLYTKEGCSLCDKAMLVMEKVGRDIPFTIEKIDIAEDALLLGRYRWAIPVVCIDGVEVFRHRVDQARFEALLRDGEDL